MTDWSKCPAVERVPGRVSGNWVFTGTRLPVYALFENLAEGATIYDFIEWFDGAGERKGWEIQAKGKRLAAVHPRRWTYAVE